MPFEGFPACLLDMVTWRFDIVKIVYARVVIFSLEFPGELIL